MRRLGLVMAVVAVVSFLAAAAGIDVRASYGARTTGDEPYYLITAASLWEDRDLDISDEIEAEAFHEWHEIPLDEQTKPLDGGRRVSPHDPLLPVVLAPALALGGWMGAKLFLALMAGVLGALIVWLAVRRFAVSLLAAGLAGGVFGAAAPFAVYGSQVYPELPAALCVAVALIGLTGRSRGGLVALGAAITALPWLSIKYVPVAATLALIGIVLLWRAGRRHELVGFAGGLAVMGVAFVAAHLQWYDGVTPYAVGDHFTSGEFSVVGNDPDYPGRARRLLGLLVDRHFGLVAWQPAWFLIVPAVAALVRARPPHSSTLAFPLAVGWLNATFVAFTMQGWWWPGRQLVVVLPCAVVCIAWWADRSRARLSSSRAHGIVGRPDLCVARVRRSEPPHHVGGRLLRHDQSALRYVAPRPAGLPQRHRDDMDPARSMASARAHRGGLGLETRLHPRGRANPRESPLARNGCWGPCYYSTVNSVDIPSWKWFSISPSSSSTMLQKRT